VHRQTALHFSQVGYLPPSPAAQVGYNRPPPECITISEAIAIQFPASSATSSHENPSALNIMNWFQCHGCNCCVDDYNPCTADFDPPENADCLGWFMEPFCAFFGLRIPWRCFFRRGQEVCCEKSERHLCICCLPFLGPFWLCSILYYVSLGLVMIPWMVCLFLAILIECCEKPCCGRRSTLFKCFYYPPMFIASSFRWLWRLCGSRTCFGLFRGPCGPDCKVHHQAVCIVCGRRHRKGDLNDENHRCDDGSRGSFAWNCEEGDPACPC
jgi:hypothetical protein